MCIKWIFLTLVTKVVFCYLLVNSFTILHVRSQLFASQDSMISYESTVLALGPILQHNLPYPLTLGRLSGGERVFLTSHAWIKLTEN